MTVSPSFFTLLESFEGFRSCPYLDSGDVATIGIGTTHYPTGVKVRTVDTCITHDTALAYAKVDVNNTAEVVATQLPKINQNQFDALVSFTYNVGDQAFMDSTLLHKAKINANDPAIKTEFLKWVMVKGKKSSDLMARRTKESTLYFKPI